MLPPYCRVGRERKTRLAMSTQAEPTDESRPFTSAMTSIICLDLRRIDERSGQVPKLGSAKFSSLRDVVNELVGDYIIR